MSRRMRIVATKFWGKDALKNVATLDDCRDRSWGKSRIGRDCWMLLKRLDTGWLPRPFLKRKGIRRTTSLRNTNHNRPRPSQELLVTLSKTAWSWRDENDGRDNDGLSRRWKPMRPNRWLPRRLASKRARRGHQKPSIRSYQELNEWTTDFTGTTWICHVPLYSAISSAHDEGTKTYIHH